MTKTLDCLQQERKERIIQTAFTMFCELGVEQTNLKQIAQCAQVGDMTLYRYFGSKPNLVLSVLDAFWNKINRQIGEQVIATANYDTMTGIEQIQVMLHCFHSMYLENADFIRFSFEAKIYLVHHRVCLPVPMFDRMLDLREPCINAVEKGRRDGSISTEEDDEALFYAICGSIRGYMIKIILCDLLHSVQNPWEACFPVLERGILSALRCGWR